MASIVFIVQGEGRGHLSQSMALQEILESRGHRVIAVWTGRNPKHSLPDYFEEAFKGRIHLFNSPFFLRTPNRRGIYVGRTLLYNLMRSIKYVKALRHIRRGIEELAPDVVVNFYDALGALAMKSLPDSIKKIGVGHHFLLHLEDYPCRGGKPGHKSLLAWHTRIVMKGCDRVLALSFREIPSRDQIKVVPPLIRKKFRELEWKPGDHSLVYLLSEGFIGKVLAMAQEDSGFRAHVFSELPKDTPMPDGIRLHAFKQEDFLQCLGTCERLVATAGFDTIAEAAYLGIPLGVVPVENHYEQACNAHDVERSRIGIVLDDRSMGEISPMDDQDRIRFREWVDRASEMVLNQMGL